ERPEHGVQYGLEIGRLPLCLGEEIVDTTEREQPAVKGAQNVTPYAGAADGLNGKRLNGCEHVLDAMVQLIHQRLLMLLRLLALADVDHHVDLSADCTMCDTQR